MLLFSFKTINCQIVGVILEEEITYFVLLIFFVKYFTANEYSKYRITSTEYVHIITKQLFPSVVQGC